MLVLGPGGLDFKRSLYHKIGSTVLPESYSFWRHSQMILAQDEGLGVLGKIMLAGEGTIFRKVG